MCWVRLRLASAILSLRYAIEFDKEAFKLTKNVYFKQKSNTYTLMTRLLYFYHLIHLLAKLCIISPKYINMKSVVKLST